MTKSSPKRPREQERDHSPKRVATDGLQVGTPLLLFTSRPPVAAQVSAVCGGEVLLTEEWLQNISHRVNASTTEDTRCFCGAKMPLLLHFFQSLEHVKVLGV